MSDICLQGSFLSQYVSMIVETHLEMTDIFVNDDGFREVGKMKTNMIEHERRQPVLKMTITNYP
jgi:hypothetical protein